MMEKRDFFATNQDTWDATQSERVDESSVFSSSIESRHVSVCDGIRVEAVPGSQDGSVKVVGGPLATADGEADGTVLAFLSFLNAFYIKDGVFRLDDARRVFFEIETSDPSREDGGIDAAAQTVSSSAGGLVPLVEAVCTGRLSLKDAVGRLANIRPSIGRAELDSFIESLRRGDEREEKAHRRSLVDEVRKTEHPEIIDAVESEDGDVEGVVEVHGKFRPFRISSFAGGSRAKLHLTLFPGLVGNEGASSFALKIADLAVKDGGWRRVAVDPRDGECIYVVQVLTDLLGPAVSEALRWALEHGDECVGLAWSASSTEDAEDAARRRIMELLGGAPAALESTE